jgi:hypothetical protein
MALFSKPIAHVYIKELRARLDSLVVPVFTPDVTIEVGDFGSFEDGRFIRKGNLRDRNVAFECVENRVGGLDFASEGKVTISPGVTVPSPTGGTLVKATISFNQSRAVVVSFKGGEEVAVRDADAFGETLMRLWLGNELRRDRAVVWSLRRATGGTVLASEQGDNAVDVMADSALLGAAGITLPNLSLGVAFGNERKATWKLSEPELPMIVWIRLLRVGKQFAEDTFHFEGDAGALERAAAQSRPDHVGVDEVLDQMDVSAGVAPTS